MVGRKVDPVKAERAKRKLQTAINRRDNTEYKLTEAIDKLYSECFHAFQEGVRYSELAELLGVSEVRIFQILKEQRELRAS